MCQSKSLPDRKVAHPMTCLPRSSLAEMQHRRTRHDRIVPVLGSLRLTHPVYPSSLKRARSLPVPLPRPSCHFPEAPVVPFRTRVSFHVPGASSPPAYFCLHPPLCLVGGRDVLHLTCIHCQKRQTLLTCLEVQLGKRLPKDELSQLTATLPRLDPPKRHGRNDLYVTVTLEP